MVSSWGLWRPFPHHESGGHIEAPIGPGVYEVRHADTGELIAFGSATSVAQALSKVVPQAATARVAVGRTKLVAVGNVATTRQSSAVTGNAVLMER